MFAELLKETEKVNEIDLKKAAAGVMIGASLLGAPMADAEAAHRKGIITWDAAIDRYMTDENIVAKVLAGESTDDEGMKAVACVIQNRMKKQPWASAKDIVVARKQFEPITNPEMMERNYKDKKEMADFLASKIGTLSDITDGATQFRSQAQFNAHKGYYRKTYDVTKMVGGNVFMKEKKK